MHRSYYAIYVGLCLSLAAPTIAHEGLHAMIDAKTKQIQTDSKNPNLYFERAEFYRAHGDYDAAFVDYEQAEALKPELAEVDLGRGRMMFEAGWFKSAHLLLTRFLDKNPDNAQGHLYHAHTLVKLGQHLAAAAEYTRTIELSSPPLPEMYIWRAETLAAAGDSYIKEALQGLDEGMKKYGRPIITLQLSAIDLELKQKQYDAALKRLETLAAQSPRKESWLARKGEILEQAGRFAEAKKALDQALQAIDSLAPARRHTKMVTDLETRIKEALKRYRVTTTKGAE